MPDRWWTRLISRSDGAKPVRFIMIDTSPMIASYRDTDSYMHDHEGGINDEYDRVEEQMEWLEAQLAIPEEVKIVVGHHPAFSYMDYGSENRKFLETRVVALLEKYEVLAYFAGHDHNLQFAQPRLRSTSYFVSGAGSRLRDGPVKTAVNEFHFYYVVHGFLACTIDDEQLTVAAVDMYGKLLNHIVVP